MRLKVEVGAALDSLVDVSADVQVAHYDIGFRDLGAFGNDPSMRPGRFRFVCKRSLTAGHRLRLTVFWGDGDTPLLSTPAQRLSAQGTEMNPQGRVIFTGWLTGPGRPDYLRGGWEYEAVDLLAYEGSKRWWTGLGTDHQKAFIVKGTALYQVSYNLSMVLYLEGMLGVSRSGEQLESAYDVDGLITSAVFWPELRGDSVGDLVSRLFVAAGILFYGRPDGATLAGISSRTDVGFHRRLSAKQVESGESRFVVLTPSVVLNAQEGRWSEIDALLTRRPVLRVVYYQTGEDPEVYASWIGGVDVPTDDTVDVTVEILPRFVLPSRVNLDVSVTLWNDGRNSNQRVDDTTALPRSVLLPSESGVGGVAWTVRFGPAVESGVRVNEFSLLSNNQGPPHAYRVVGYYDVGYRDLKEIERRRLGVLEERDLPGLENDIESGMRRLHNGRRLVRWDVDVDDDAEFLARLALGDVATLAVGDAFASYYPNGICVLGIGFDVGRVGHSEQWRGRGQAYGLTRDAPP